MSDLIRKNNFWLVVAFSFAWLRDELLQRLIIFLSPFMWRVCHNEVLIIKSYHIFWFLKNCILISGQQDLWRRQCLRSASLPRLFVLGTGLTDTYRILTFYAQFWFLSVWFTLFIFITKVRRTALLCAMLHFTQWCCLVFAKPFEADGFRLLPQSGRTDAPGW